MKIRAVRIRPGDPERVDSQAVALDDDETTELATQFADWPLVMKLGEQRDIFPFVICQPSAKRSMRERLVERRDQLPVEV